MMIKISDLMYISSDEISRIEVNSYRNGIKITMKDGTSHGYEVEYGASVYKELDKLVEKINSK